MTKYIIGLTLDLNSLPRFLLCFLSFTLLSIITISLLVFFFSNTHTYTRKTKIIFLKFFFYILIVIAILHAVFYCRIFFFRLKLHVGLVFSLFTTSKFLDSVVFVDHVCKTLNLESFFFISALDKIEFSI